LKFFLFPCELAKLRKKELNVTLENINFFIKTLKNKENNLEELNIII